MVRMMWNWVSFFLHLALTTAVLVSTALGMAMMGDALHHSGTSEPGSARSHGPFLPPALCQGLIVCSSAGPSVLSLVRSVDETWVHMVFNLFSVVDHTET